MTGKAGVAIATSGPGVSNLVTGWQLHIRRAIQWSRSGVLSQWWIASNLCIKQWTR